MNSSSDGLEVVYFVRFLAATAAAVGCHCRCLSLGLMLLDQLRAKIVFQLLAIFLRPNTFFCQNDEKRKNFYFEKLLKQKTCSLARISSVNNILTSQARRHLRTL